METYVMVLKPFLKLYIALNEPRDRVWGIYGAVYVSGINKFEHTVFKSTWKYRVIIYFWSSEIFVKPHIYKYTYNHH